MLSSFGRIGDAVDRPLHFPFVRISFHEMSEKLAIGCVWSTLRRSTFVRVCHMMLLAFLVFSVEWSPSTRDMWPIGYRAQALTTVVRYLSFRYLLLLSMYQSEELKRADKQLMSYVRDTEVVMHKAMDNIYIYIYNPAL